jgi:stage V sporulation protein SpoVS
LAADVAIDGVNKDSVPSVILTDDADNGILSPHLWSNVLDENDEPYKSFQDYYGPHTINGDSFTSIRRYNVSQNGRSRTHNKFKNITQQLFHAGNIVLIQDGFCGSTCAMFAELTREQGKVQTVVVGGRAVNQAIQAVGSSKGSQHLGLSAIQSFSLGTVEVAKELDGEAVARHINETTSAGKINAATQLIKRSPISGTGTYPYGGVDSLKN